MSDQQKLWFIYLTDHHEGPFTPAEVAEKISQGTLTAQSLAWKDGMPEWLAIEAIPELSSAIQAGSPAAAAPAEIASAASPEPAPGGDGEFSLAQLLAQQQSGTPAASATSPEPEMAISGNRTVLTSLAGAVQTGVSDSGTGGVELSGAGGSEPAQVAEAVDPNDEIWTLKIGNQVSGLYSLNRLIEIAGEGEIPPDGKLWRTGWSDFQLLATVPEVAAARRSKKTMSSQSTGTFAGSKAGAKVIGAARGGIAPITAAANIGDDDPTDPSISVPEGRGGFKAKIQAFFSRFQKRAQQKPAASAAKPAAKAGKKGLPAFLGSMKHALAILLVVGILAGGATGYLLFFSSPIPSNLDVIPDDLEKMRILAKQSPEQGFAMHLALARGTEDDPADVTTPKFYVATNLPEGAPVSLEVVGQPGTLVNRIHFRKTFSANVGASRMAVFERIDDDGKPLPMGEYEVRLHADGAAPFVVNRFLGGNKSGAYTSRLNQYKEKVQREYDQEMQELRELIDTLKNLQTDISKRLVDYRENFPNPTNRMRVQTDWRAFSMGAEAMANQLSQKINAKASDSSIHLYHRPAFENLKTAVSHLQALSQATGQWVGSGESGAPAPDEQEKVLVAEVNNLEQFLSQVLTKSPFEVMGEGAGSQIQ